MSRFAIVCSQTKQIRLIFTHLMSRVAVATHNFKWEKIQIGLTEHLSCTSDMILYEFQSHCLVEAYTKTFIIYGPITYIIEALL